MKKNTKILIGIIVLLTLLNLTIVGTMLYKKNEITRYKDQDKKEIVIPTNHLGRFFKQEKSDTIILNKLSKDLGNLHTELKNLTIQYYLDMKEVCNEKQKVKLFQLFKTMVNSNGSITMPKEKNYKNN